MKPCNALPCFNCKAAHHTLMCPQGQNGDVLLTDLDKEREDDQDPDQDKDDEGDDDDEFLVEDSQVFMPSYEEEQNDLDDFDPEDESLYEEEDSPNDVDVGADNTSQILLTNTIDDKNVSVNTNSELVQVEYEEVEEDTMMLEPEEASKNSELITDEIFEEDLSLQIKKERVDKDKDRNSYLDNELTKSNKIELQKWALKFDSKKKEKAPSKSSKVVVQKTIETPLA